MNGSNPAWRQRKPIPAFTDADVTAVFPPERLADAFPGRVDAFFLDDYTEGSDAV